jgi:hypothetical protein
MASNNRKIILGTRFASSSSAQEGGKLDDIAQHKTIGFGTLPEFLNGMFERFTYTTRGRSAAAGGDHSPSAGMGTLRTI